MATDRRERSRGRGEEPRPTRIRPLASTLLAVVLAAWIVTTTSIVGGALAHTGHDHADTAADGDLLLPGALLLGGGAVLGTSVYLDRRGEIEGWMARAAHLLAALGLLAGALLVLF